MLLSRKIALALAWLSLAPGAMAETRSASSPEPSADPAPHRRLSTQSRPWTGDFDQMLERRRIRVLVPYSRSLYFNDKGFERGLSAESVRAFEKWLNRKYAKQLKNRPVTVLIGPRTRDRLLPEVTAGAGGLAGRGLTLAPPRPEAVVVDDWKAKMWAQILRGISVNEQAVLRAGSQIGWAIRKGSPKLEAEIMAFMKAEATRGIIAWHVDQAMRRVKRLKNPNDRA